jgi:hypothetical protein
MLEIAGLLDEISWKCGVPRPSGSTLHHLTGKSRQLTAHRKVGGAVRR